MGPRPAATPAGSARRQLGATRSRSARSRPGPSSVRPASAPSAPATNTPTPVRTPSSGVASTATAQHGCSRAVGHRATATPPSSGRGRPPAGSVAPVIVALAGGVGAARMLRGLVDVVDPAEIVAVVNTGDDIVLHGLHISPDLDTVTYTLAGAINPETGWGLAGETWAAMDALGRATAGDWPGSASATATSAPTCTAPAGWPRAPPCSEVTAEIADALGRRRAGCCPMSDDRVETRVTVDGEGEIGFQEYFVGRHHERAGRARSASPAPSGPARRRACSRPSARAERIVICPSNPIVSIGPVLAVPGVRDAVDGPARRRRGGVAHRRRRRPQGPGRPDAGRARPRGVGGRRGPAVRAAGGHPGHRRGRRRAGRRGRGRGHALRRGPDGHVTARPRRPRWPGPCSASDGGAGCDRQLDPRSRASPEVRPGRRRWPT